MLPEVEPLLSSVGVLQHVVVLITAEAWPLL